MSTGCHICNDVVLRRWVDEEIDKGEPFARISRLAGLRGYPVSAGVISSHVNNRHRDDYAKDGAPAPKATKRDAAVVIKDRVLNALEARADIEDHWVDGPDGERTFVRGVSILDKDIQPALGTALKAQAIEDRREQHKVPSVTFVLQLAAALGKALELPDGLTIEGEATEID